MFETIKDKIHSDFWLGGRYLKDENDHISLAMHRRAISNFVSILTKKNIPVKFRVAGDSCTNGKVVFITSKLDREHYDVAVGLALHEGSHILLSDFNLLIALEKHIPQHIWDKAASAGLDKVTTRQFTFNMLNYVEDRFIDNYVYSTAPGYRGYYKALYNKYFNHKKTTKVLKTNEYCEETLENYTFRIVNLTNSGTRLDALGGLLDIAKTINFKNISRMKLAEDRLSVALAIVDIVLNNIGKMPQAPKQKSDYSVIPKKDGDEADSSWPSKFDDMSDLLEKDEDGDSSGGNSKSDDEAEESDDDLFGGISSEIQKQEDGEADKSGGKPEKKEDKLSDADKNAVEDHLQEIIEYMAGEVKKKEISQDIAQTISAIEESGTELVKVGTEVRQTECVVVNNLTESLMLSDSFLLTGKEYGGKLQIFDNSQTAVDEGMRLGKALGKKLKVRGETRVTKFTRKRVGKIDKRLISDLGFNSESVFFKLDLDEYKKTFMHISIDASTSMSGSKWANSLTCAVAIATAASMVENLQVAISFRVIHGNGLPCTVFAYNSTNDKIGKINRTFPHFRVCSSTPEGLCFESILDKIPGSSPDSDSYFLNFSDGEPYYQLDEMVYHGTNAVTHTKKQVDRIRAKGVSVISFFISDSSRTSNLGNFKTMYGRDASNIDVTNVTQIASLMNRKFLEKQ